MKDERTKEERYSSWVYAVAICHSKGWKHHQGWQFYSPSNTLHDLSAADLFKLDSIEKNGHFLIN